MFVDEAKIHVQAGAGGNGCVGFRREKYVPAGGPAGGDGGRGGSVIAEVDPGLSTLLDFRYRQHYKAASGEHGMGSDMHGKNAGDLVIKVPPGTIIRNAETGEVIADLTRPGQRVIIARGGRGGRGNARYATPTRQAPRFAEMGEPGEGLWCELELKLLADVGLAGYPNVGKSSLIARISAAKPKISDYPFTTLVPNLGVVDLGDGKSCVMADIPGLIEGAHSGVGLGHEFLKHIERTLLIVHILDTSGLEGRDPLEDFDKINEELRLFSADLATRPQLVAANKLDLAEARERFPRVKEALNARGCEVFPISAATGHGLKELLGRIASELDRLRAVRAQAEADTEASQAAQAREELEQPERWRKPRRASMAEEITVRREDGCFVVEGKALEKLVAMTNLDNEDAVRFFQRTLVRRGVMDALRNAGVKPGDTVRIKDAEFDFVE
ncbi:MAG: GTPase ObgE [Firmicutes bacterium]|nr:GTPase ObgE [Bacillota bacterium]